jgi:hypothetical protein
LEQEYIHGFNHFLQTNKLSSNLDESKNELKKYLTLLLNSNKENLMPLLEDMEKEQIEL